MSMFLWPKNGLISLKLVPSDFHVQICKLQHISFIVKINIIKNISLKIIKAGLEVTSKVSG